MCSFRLILVGLLAGAALSAQEAVRSEPIDLVTVLRLAGAESLDVKLAEARVSEARATADSATWALFPTISPGVTYRKHSGQLQDIVGQVLDVNKESLSAGATLGVSLELGEAVYRRLAAKQTARAAEHQLDAQRRQTVLAATTAYFDLTRSHHAVTLLEDSVRTSKEYRGQLAKGVGAGVTFKGDELRAAAAVSRLELRLRQALELRRGDAARLAQVLRLKITETLVPADDRPLPLTFAENDRKLDDHVRIAMAKLFLQEPAALLLDEPTNHLDIEAIAWLEAELKSTRAAFVLISHDRAFLRNLTRATLWIDRGQVRRAEEGFDGFEEWRDKRG